MLSLEYDVVLREACMPLVNRHNYTTFMYNDLPYNKWGKHGILSLSFGEGALQKLIVKY